MWPKPGPSLGPLQCYTVKPVHTGMPQGQSFIPNV